MIGTFATSSGLVAPHTRDPLASERRPVSQTNDAECTPEHTLQTRVSALQDAGVRA